MAILKRILFLDHVTGLQNGNIHCFEAADKGGALGFYYSLNIHLYGINLGEPSNPKDLRLTFNR